MTEVRTEAAVALAPPRYGVASLADLLPSAIAALGVREHGDEDLLGLGRHRAVIVLVADGLGADLLDAHAALAPFLSGQPRTDIDAAFPSTTVSSLASIGTGRPPGRHGLTGYAIGVPGETQPLNLLTWRVGLRGGGWDARTRHVPEALQPAPTALERASHLGIRVAVVVHPHFLDSGLTRAALRGGARVPATGPVETLTTAVSLAAHPGATLVYAHHGPIDTAGHVHGPGSQRWCEELARFDREVARAATAIPPDTLLLVTADHGMLEVAPDEVLDLADRPDLTAGVRVLAGEPRARHVHVEDGALGDVLDAWTAALAGRAVVATREQAIAAGWFGPEIADPVRPRIGDLVVVSHRGTVVHRRVDPHQGRHRGQHGGLSPAEVRVPLIRIDTGAGT